jgi:hypothetical protein
MNISYFFPSYFTSYDAYINSYHALRLGWITQTHFMRKNPNIGVYCTSGRIPIFYARGIKTAASSDSTDPFKGLCTPVKKYDGLSLTDNLRAAVKAERGLSGIYAIVNTTNGKVYVGSSSVSIGRRLNDHFFKTPKMVIQHSIAKYGASSFEVYILEYIESAGTTTREAI